MKTPSAIAAATRPPWQVLYDTAWGKSWPSREATITRADISTNPIDVYDFHGPLFHDVKHADRLVYKSLLGVRSVGMTIAGDVELCSNLVVLREYHRLLKIIDKRVEETAATAPAGDVPYPAVLG